MRALPAGGGKSDGFLLHPWISMSKHSLQIARAAYTGSMAMPAVRGRFSSKPTARRMWRGGR